MTAPQAGGERRQRRDALARQRADQRDQRWANNRFSVPYALDGPKVLLGFAWFALAIGLFALDPRALMPLLVAIASVSALQTAFAWSADESTDRLVAAFVAGIVALCGFFGLTAVGLGVLIGVVVCIADGLAVGVTEPMQLIRFADVMVRSSIPAGLAMASLAMLATDWPDAFVALLLLVSAYEAGDFLIGSGADNAIEGPIAGLLGVGVLGVGMTFVQPYPFDATSMPAFAAMAAVCCVRGQHVGSAILPHGIAWAPALRRLDSYLLIALLWALLVPSLAGAT
ncbi:MAG: hypothetical protein R2706_15975 [Acidimicrobiales bacterium]